MRLLVKYFILVAVVCSAKVSLRIGIIFDEHASDSARLMKDSFPNYSKEAFTDVLVQSVLYDLTKLENVTAEITVDNLSAVLVLAEKLNCKYLNSIKNVMPIFVVAGSTDDCNRRDGYTGIQYLFPSNKLIISTIVKATERYGWSRAIVLEQASEEIHFSFSDMQHARENGLETMAFEASTDREALKDTLRTSQMEGQRAYILACPVATVLTILQIAEELELLTENYHWFVPNVFMTPGTMQEFMQKGLRISYLYSPFITPVVESLLQVHNDTSKTEFIINDVISALGHVVLDHVIKSCINAKNIGCLLRNTTTGDFQCFHNISTSIPQTSKPHVIYKRSVPNLPGSVTEASAHPILVGNYKALKKVKRHIVCHYKESSNNNEVKKTQTKTQRIKRSLSSSSALHTECLVHNIPSSITNYTIHVAEDYYGIIGEDLNGSIAMESASYNFADFTIVSKIDACEYLTNHTWSYPNSSCGDITIKYFELDLAGLIMIIEYVRLPTTPDILSPLIVGVYNNPFLYEVQIEYKELLTYDVTLPKRPMRVCTVYQPPWLSWTQSEGDTIKPEGHLYDILLALSEAMRFEYELVTHSYFAQGNTNETKEEIEDKMYELFINNTCDFFLYPQVINGERLAKARRIDISDPYQSPRMFLITKRIEKADSIDIWQFMLPFRQISWVVFWTTFILISLLLAFINSKNPNEYQAISTDFGPNSDSSDHLGIMNSLWFNYAAIAQQGADIVPRSKAAKCLTATWWAFVLLVLSAYTANMTAFMTQVNQGTIETLEELATQQDFEYGIVKDNAMLKYLFPSAKDRPFTTIYSYIKKNGEYRFEDNKSAFEKLRAGNFYVISSYEMAVEAMANSCEFDISGPGFYQYQFGLPFPKGSVYTQLFNDYIKRFSDSGVFMDLEDKWFNLESECENQNTDSGTSEGQLDLRAFIGMYVFLIIGIMIGFAICVIETGWIRCGGIGGFFGKARIYQIEGNKRENIKKNELLEKEFKTWEGGWDVWKFKEWNSEIVPDDSQPNVVQWCHICGRPAPDKSHSDVIKGSQEIVLSDKKYKSRHIQNNGHKQTEEAQESADADNSHEECNGDKLPSVSRQDGHLLIPTPSSFSDKLEPTSRTNSVLSHSSLESGSINLPDASGSSTPTTVFRPNSTLYKETSPLHSSLTTISTISQRDNQATPRHRRMISGSSEQEYYSHISWNDINCHEDF